MTGDGYAARVSGEEFRRTLPTRHLGRAVRYFASCGSTNDVAFDLAEAGAPHGTLVLADAQTQGRGRRGRTWHSPPGVALYASLVLRCEGAFPAPTLLVAAAGLGLAEGLEEASGAAIGIKWPNDLWCGGRKVAGILVEARGTLGADAAIVAGFGVNVNQRPQDFPPEVRGAATSLALVTGRRLDRAEVLRSVLAALEPRVEEAMSVRGAPALHEAYRRRSVLLGQRVALLDGDLPLEGVVADLSATGGLLLRLADGRHRHVLAEHARDVRAV